MTSQSILKISGAEVIDRGFIVRVDIIEKHNQIIATIANPNNSPNIGAVSNSHIFNTDEIIETVKRMIICMESEGYSSRNTINRSMKGTLFNKDTYSLEEIENTGVRFLSIIFDKI